MIVRNTQESINNKVSDIIDDLTEDQKKIIAESAGWQMLWHADNWVKTCWLEQSYMNIDWAGESLNNVVKRILKEKM